MYIHQQLERQSQRPSIDHDCNKYYVCHCNISFVLDGHLKIKENNKYKKGKMIQEGLKKKDRKKTHLLPVSFPAIAWKTNAHGLPSKKKKKKSLKHTKQLQEVQGQT